MDPITKQLLELLTVEQLDKYLFRAPSAEIFGSRIYGGQLLGQSVMIATQLCSHHLHSLHASFIFAGDASQPVLYQVNPLQEGRSFFRYNINAYQNGMIIFTAMLSFARHEDGVIYQPEVPCYPEPESLKTEQAHREEIACHLDEPFKQQFIQPFHIDIRPIGFMDPIEPQQTTPHYAEYLKTYSALDADTSQALHMAIVAYYSDYSLMNSALRPHGLSYINDHVQSASLDHSLYFHLPVKADQWMLYDMDCKITAQARGLNIGYMWQSNQLVCTALQENLMRIHANA